MEITAVVFGIWSAGGCCEDANVVMAVVVVVVTISLLAAAVAFVAIVSFVYGLLITPPPFRATQMDLNGHVWTALIKVVVVNMANADISNLDLSQHFSFRWTMRHEADVGISREDTETIMEGNGASICKELVLEDTVKVPMFKLL